ncbi:membrane protein YqaA, SNARE-associated domain [Jannaschia faecimaris]|uniref:Membrane protein YqaA, SNARE-associated domain n=1 Tax=Jannaschia faecimaris TaxID=1244108 RepID=A0A1H3P135_9RHOB|nr:YqaA family protein [Jannaschia faecimaris]SDY94129.1 membrane protein YqaA, SNARE-associated domain [Jannaschia faecimaris]
MIRSLYNWTLSWAAHPRALWVLAIVSFVESSIFPIPPDILLIPMVLAAPSRAWLTALVCTAASVAGGMAGYAIGFFAFETLGEPVLTALGKADSFEAFRARYNEWGSWAVLIAGVTPFPYKVITILSGGTQLSLPVFIVSSVVARGLRFFIVAGLLWKFGPPIRGFIERHLGLVFSAFFVVLIGAFVLLRFI